VDGRLQEKMQKLLKNNLINLTFQDRNSSNPFENRQISVGLDGVMSRHSWQMQTNQGSTTMIDHNAPPLSTAAVRYDFAGCRVTKEYFFAHRTRNQKEVMLLNHITTNLFNPNFMFNLKNSHIMEEC
jgi:hypothetical protein